jgi:SsrA-binding protein
MPKETGRKLIASNRRARHDYHLDDTYGPDSCWSAPR